MAKSRQTNKTARGGARRARPDGKRVFYFGAQYFRPPTPLREDWDRDFRNMAKAGMNIIRAWCLWSWHNPADGQYDWSDIDGLLEQCRKHDMKAILLVSLESVPGWVLQRHPEAVYEANNGIRNWPDGFGNHPSGGFPGLNMDYPQVRALAETWLREFVRRYRGHAQVWGWEPHNEPIIEPARMKFDREEVYSYNEPTLEHFRAWCKRKYRTIDRLNAQWHRKYSSFDEIQPPRRIPGGTAGDFLDWTLHNMEALIERVQWRIDVMRDEDPDIHLMIHTRAYTCTQGNPATWGMDDWRLAQLPDTWGGSSFYRRWPDAGYFLNNDVLYSCAKGKEFWLSEVQGGPPGGGLNRPGGTDNSRGDYTPEHFEMWTLMPVAQGAKGFMYWQFRPERKGPEIGYGVMNLDGSPSPRYDRAVQLGRFFHENADLLMEAQVEPYQVAIGYCPHSPALEFINSWKVWDYAESLMGAYKANLHLDLPSYFVRLDEEAVDDDYSPYKLLVVPMGMWISPKSVEKLRRYVRNGGTLIADAMFGEYDHQLLWSKAVPGFGLDDVFGCRRANVRSHPKVGQFAVDTERPVTHTILGREFRSAWYEEWLEPTTADVIGEWPNGAPAVTINRYGKGKAVYIGSSATLAYSHNEHPALLELFRTLTQDIARPAWTDRNETHVRVLRRGRQRMYWVFNYCAQRLWTTLTIPGHKGALKDLRSGETVETQRAAEGASLRLDMTPFQVRIFITE